MTRRLNLEATSLSGVYVLHRRPIGDERGYFERMFCDTELAEWLGGRGIRQINHTLTSAAGTVRGVHYQRPPHAEGKIVSCLRGEVFDVAVDLRRGSPTFLRWHAERLTSTNHRSLLIPPGVAHGFQTLVDGVELVYFHTAPFVAESEGGVHPQEPRVGISWPRPITTMSERDAAHPWLTGDFTGVDA